MTLGGDQAQKSSRADIRVAGLRGVLGLMLFSSEGNRANTEIMQLLSTPPHTGNILWWVFLFTGEGSTLGMEWGG